MSWLGKCLKSSWQLWTYCGSPDCLHLHIAYDKNRIVIWLKYYNPGFPVIFQQKLEERKQQEFGS